MITRLFRWLRRSMDRVTLIAERDFVDESVLIDGRNFNSCKFTRCELVYRGTHPIAMKSCRFDGCMWVFEGPAGSTIKMLRTMNRDCFDDTVSQVIEYITDQKPKL